MPSPAVSPLRGEIWIVNLNPVVGHEQAGERTCLVVSDNELNQGPFGLIIVVPTTKTTGRDFPFQVKITPSESGLNYESMIQCDQVRSVSISRFKNKVGQRMTGGIMKKVEDTLKILLNIR